jgi:DNA-binding MarR family transcriptional regulator/N-acetylglutamate synthase-like GNAT family acetyltransferase
MKDPRIETLRNSSRKLIRELGMLQLNQGSSKTTPGHWHALIEVSKEPGITISKLGDLLLVSKSTISRIVSALAKEGTLKMTEGRDKREKYLYLTDKGKAELKKIDAFSESKINASFEFLTDTEIEQILQSICLYCQALEQGRHLREQVKIRTLSTSRTLRKQIISMIENIQKEEFAIPITEEINFCILKAEDDFYYNQSYNFWYATDEKGKIIGSIGLKKIDERLGEVKKFFVSKLYRGKGVAQKLISTLLKAASKHQFEALVLGTVETLKAAHQFYRKLGFRQIDQNELPSSFERCHLDTLFFKATLKELTTKKSILN